MTSPREPFVAVDAETLLAHAAWLASFARALVGSKDDVDDVLQQTYTQALARLPRHAGNLRGWLGTIARNVVRSGARSEGARVAREAAWPTPAPVESPVEAVERAEMRRRVVAAVLAIDEPYRTTVVLRYFEERSVAEIARLMKTNEDTVRTRMRRGVQRVREVLEREAENRARGTAGGPAAAQALLLAQLRDLAASGGGSAAPVARPLRAPRAGRWTASVAARRVLIGACAVTVAAGGWWWSHAPRRETAAPTDVAQERAAPGEATRPEPAPTAAPAVERSAEAAPPPTSPPTTAPPAVPVRELATVRGIVTSPDGSPVPHARVWAIASPSFERTLDLAKFAARAAKTAEGEAKGKRTANWNGADADADGRYEIAGLERVAGWTIGAFEPTTGAALGDVCSFDHAHAEANVDLQLVAGRHVFGLVRDASSTPIGNATFTLFSTVAKQVTTTKIVTLPVGASVGEFDAGFVCGEPLEFEAFAPSFAPGKRHRLEFAPHLPGVRPVVTLRRLPGTVVRGRIVDGYGHPVELDLLLPAIRPDSIADVQVTLMTVHAIPEPADGAAAATTAETEGRIDFVDRRYDFVLPEGFRGRAELRISGVVVGGVALADLSRPPDLPCDVDRLPKRGAPTTFLAQFLDAETKDPLDLAGLEPPHVYDADGKLAVARASGSRPDRGVVEYGCLPGESVLQALVPGHEPGQFRFVVPEGPPSAPVPFELQRSAGAIRGVVLHADGRPFAKARVFVHRVTPAGPVESNGADLATNPDGEFLCTSATAGEHLVLVSGLPDEAPAIARVVVSGPESKVELHCLAGVETRFRIAASGGETGAGTRLRIVDERSVAIEDTQRGWPPATLRSNDYRTVLAPGRYHVVVTRRGFQEATREFTVPAGEAVEVRLEPLASKESR